MMRVVFMVNGEIEREDDMAAVPRIGETVWLTLTCDNIKRYTPTIVTAVDWHSCEYVELRLSPTHQRNPE